MTWRYRPLCLLLVAAGMAGGYLLHHPKVRYDGAEIIYRNGHPLISNRSTASDALRYLDDHPRARRIVGLEGIYPVREWTWSNGKSWTLTVTWLGGPEPPA